MDAFECMERVDPGARRVGAVTDVSIRDMQQHSRWRPYRVERTGSLPTSEVKRRRARLVLGWGTAREDLRVLPAFVRGRQSVALKRESRRCPRLTLGGSGSELLLTNDIVTWT